MVNFFLDEVTDSGFVEHEIPIVLNEDSFFATGQLPDKENQMYKVDDNFSRLKNHSQIISLKQINTNNNKDNKKISNNNFINNEKDKLLNRINNEKINNLLGRNYLNEGKKNKKIIPNYSQINKVSYINMIKKPFDQKKSNFVEKIFNNSNLNYPSSTSNIKSFNNKKYDILYEYKNKDVKNIISEHKSVTNLNNKVNNYCSCIWL